MAAAFILSGCGEAPSLPLPAPEYSTPSPAPETAPLPTIEPTPVPTPADEYFTLSFCGDCTLSSSQREESFEYTVAGRMDYPFSGVREYFEDDYLTIANLECVLSDRELTGSATFLFRGAASNAAMLSEGGVELVSLGNNHAVDFGQAGLDDTRAALDYHGVAHAGPDSSYVYQSGDGISVGVYAAPWCATEYQLRAGVSALAAREDVDLVVCLVHWGDEGTYRANWSQTALGRAAIDSGADIVCGSHPHTLQPVEEYGGGYIAYSLGNFVFGGNTAPSDRDTAILRFTVKRAADGGVTVEGWEAVPCSVSSTAVINDFRPEPYEPGSAEYERAMSKLTGSFTGPDLNIDYSEFHEGGAENES